MRDVVRFAIKPISKRLGGFSSLRAYQLGEINLAYWWTVLGLFLCDDGQAGKGDFIETFPIALCVQYSGPSPRLRLFWWTWGRLLCLMIGLGQRSQVQVVSAKTHTSTYTSTGTSTSGTKSHPAAKYHRKVISSHLSLHFFEYHHSKEYAQRVVIMTLIKWTNE